MLKTKIFKNFLLSETSDLLVNILNNLSLEKTLYLDLLKKTPEHAPVVLNINTKILEKVNEFFFTDKKIYSQRLEILKINSNSHTIKHNDFNDSEDFLAIVFLNKEKALDLFLYSKNNKNIEETYKLKHKESYVLKIYCGFDEKKKNSWASSLTFFDKVKDFDGPYINSKGYEVPEKTIVVVPRTENNDGFYKEIIVPLKNKVKRDWFTSHFYYCLPLTIGNQYGFLVQSTKNFDAIWDGSENPAEITFLDDDDHTKQIVSNGFGSGIITFQNMFSIRSPLGINLMTIQPPNMFIPGCSSMTGVVESDNLRRDFTFNLKITVPNFKVSIRKGDPVAAFIPIPRNFVEEFSIDVINNIFPEEIHKSEINEYHKLCVERHTDDMSKQHGSGRRYFQGIHMDNSNYTNHQKKI
jgi:hypothetical protein